MSAEEKFSKYAFEAIDVHFIHGSGRSATKVLNGVNIKVPIGTIYCLIGPSGCGKTTLLRSGIGLIQQSSGCFRVFGHEPGSRHSGIPGPRLGYMPQDIDVTYDLTIGENLIYFGKLFKMKAEIINEKIEHLLNLLQLPESTRLVANLSDGQKRRVCFAATILHNPALAILDEPTVGVDPLLREVIWKFLVNLTKEQNMTIIITTHYIEETKRADYIAFLRQGVILSEDSPVRLMRRYNLNNLEQIFQQLCLERKKSLSSFLQTSTQSMIIPEQQQNLLTLSKLKARASISFQSSSINKQLTANTSMKIFEKIFPFNCNEFLNYFRILFVVIFRVFLRFKSRQLYLLLLAMFEVSQLLAFLTLFGQTPTKLKIGVVNNEFNQLKFNSSLNYIHNKFNFSENIYSNDESIDNTTIIANSYNNNNSNSNYNNEYYSKLFLNEINEKFVVPINYESSEQARRSVKNKSIYGYIEIGENFTEYFFTRVFLDDLDVIDTIKLNESELNLSEEKRLLIEREKFANKTSILYYGDLANKFITVTILRTLELAYKNFAEKLIKNETNYLNGEKILSPIVVDEVINGDLNYEGDLFSMKTVFSIYMLTHLRFVNVIQLSVFNLINERNEKIFERNCAAGVQRSHIIFSYLILNFTISLLPTFLMVFLSIYAFSVPCVGSLTLVFLLLLGQNLAGILTGMFISTLVETLYNSMIFCAGFQFSVLFVGGSLWTSQSLPYYIKHLRYLTSFSVPQESLVDIMVNGASFLSYNVYIGFISTYAYCIVMFILTFLSFNFF